MDYAQVDLDRPHTPDNEPIRTRYRKKNGTIKERSAVFLVCVTAMSLFGYDQGLFGGILVGDKFLEQFNDPSPGVQGFVTSIYDVGCFVGCLLCIFVGEILGRRRTIMLGVTIMSIGAILQTFSTTIGELAWGRFIAGIGNGFNTATAPVYHSEVSEAHDRGKAVVLEMFINVLGFVISNWTTLVFSSVRSNLQWRIPLAGQLVFAAIIVVTLPFAPESPRWMMMHGKREEGLVIIAQLDGMDVKSDRVQQEGAKIIESIELEGKNQIRWLDMFKGKDENSVFWRAFLGIGLQAMQQLTGINVVAYYFPVVLQKSVGISEKWSRIIAAFNSISFCISTLIPYLLIEKLGRRALLLGLSVIMTLCFLCASIFLGVVDNKPSFAHVGGILAVVAFVLFFISFGAGWCAIPWLYPAEINSIGMRTKGAALASASDWLFNYFIVQLTPLGIHHLRWKFYIIFFILNASFIPLVYLFYPETAGKSLEEIDLMFTGEKRYIVSGVQSKLITNRPITRDIEEMSLINQHDRSENENVPSGEGKSNRTNRYDSDDEQDLADDENYALGSDSDEADNNDFDYGESKHLTLSDGNYKH
ncbi:Hexose carrier protein [Taphrina deformans PYCC 5710]|uniref:Hexose carrier protein n=1 Tax=Taphrina deformans (strain PYCC 5710 / ATCC 11124 / CBS 356.35 / IMI 108563 / JCM 9778 / NBRC 8474) TaxID=1097556 RepID=R4X7L0_TAPDE|nr:Hexose carrier protein [Taphrina deformans PYCC 5710]|eukprot:CCG81390.1 Hexose carrier protein [Taphrina deformans PYCC 5710]